MPITARAVHVGTATARSPYRFIQDTHRLGAIRSIAESVPQQPIEECAAGLAVRDFTGDGPTRLRALMPNSWFGLAQQAARAVHLRPVTVNMSSPCKPESAIVRSPMENQTV